MRLFSKCNVLKIFYRCYKYDIDIRTCIQFTVCVEMYYGFDTFVVGSFVKSFLSFFRSRNATEAIQPHGKVIVKFRTKGFEIQTQCFLSNRMKRKQI